MSALAQTNTHQINSSVTSINANARIDYILRFSKHLVLVLDENGEGYGDISGQFLASLPDNHNAAYLSLSPKFNDIQVRCRVIEQLFHDASFDPEQSLLANVMGMSKNAKTPISIVIEHAQCLSLQLMHELCQLADSAKKTNREINVVLTGTIASGRLIAINPILFSQKVSMVSAQTGQLISANSALFKDEPKPFSITGYKKLMAIFFTLIAISALVIVGLYNRDNLSFSGLNYFTQAPAVEKEGDVFVGEALESTKDNENSVQAEAKEEAIAASSMDILNAIVTEQVIDEPQTPVMASPSDVYALLTAEDGAENILADVRVNDFAVDKIPEFAHEESSEVIETPFLTIISSPETADQYYTELDFGYIIQYVTLSYSGGDDAMKMVSDFTKEHEEFRFKYYFRLINEQKVIVITSEFFADKDKAKIALNTLPPSLTTHSPWIKSISTIKQEIAAFKSSL